jgi:hypothetical protein
LFESVSPPAQAVQGETGPVAAIEVAQAGLVSVSFSDLTGIGFPVQNALLTSFHLNHAGAELPLEWDGNGNEVFEPGERLLFFALPRFSRWTAADVYFLSTSNPPGMAIQSRPAVPASRPSGTASVETVLEKNFRYTPDCLCAPIPAGRDGDRWVWDNLQRPNLESGSYPFDLVNPDLTKPASLKLWLIGYTDVPAAPDHRVEVSLNGVLLGSVEWDGKQAIETDFSIPASALQASGNQLSLALPGLPGVEVEGAWLDVFSVRYARSSSPAGDSLLFEGETSARVYNIGLASTSGLRAYDVTDPHNPLRLSGLAPNPAGQISVGDTNSGQPHRYWMTSEAGLISPTRLRLVSQLSSTGATGADYVIITPDEFRPALASLVALREQQGFSVLVESVQAIFDAYGEGRPEPQAIKAFLAQAYASWNPRPAYLLLVGDGSTDPRRYYDSSPPTIIPPYLEVVDPWAGETAADNRYVTLDGADILPDLLTGRLPVNSLAEAQAVVDKIVQAEIAPHLGDRITRATVVTDNPDGGGDFPALSEDIVSRWISPLLVSNRLYYTPPGVTPESIRQGLLDDWNAGTGLIMYTGHSSVHQWAVERFFHQEDVAGLTNGDRLPVVLEMTCFTGSFHLPGLPALDESLLRHPSGGALAVWGPTGLGLSTGHGDLADGFLESVIRQGQPRIGPATLAGKVNLMAHHPEFSDLVDTFTLLGDPATQLPITPGTKPIYFPTMPK